MFQGTGTAIITPFNADLSINFDQFGKIIEYQIKNGVNAIIVLGTTGESPVIDDDEREKMVSFATEKVNGRVKVIVGTGTNDPKHVIHHNKCAEKYNADGLLIVNPYYNKGTQRSVIEHFKYICNETALPVIFYNIAGRTGLNILPDTILTIADVCPNLKGVKEASGNISQIAELIAAKPDGLMVLSGNDDQTLPIIAMGGNGVISTISNALPKEYSDLVNFALSGNFAESRKLHNGLLKLMNSLFIETNPMPVKYLMAKLGFCNNILRLPLIPVLQSTEKAIDYEYLKAKDDGLIYSEGV